MKTNLCPHYVGWHTKCHVSPNITCIWSCFQMTVEKPTPKLLLRPITTGPNSAMNQSQFLAITCNLPKAREKLRVLAAIGFDFSSRSLKIWRQIFEPITKRSNRMQSPYHTFERHLKTTLDQICILIRFKFLVFFFSNLKSSV